MSGISHATINKRMTRRLFLAFVLITAGFVGGLLLTARLHIAADSSADEVALPATPEPPPAASGQARPVTPAPAPPVVSAGPDFTRVAGQAVKGVANISSLQVTRTSNSPFAADPFFRYFFGDQGDVFGGDRRSLSLGSGVIISSDGYIVTNNHVVGDNMREITVSLPNKREVRGRLVGTDPATDIALVKLNVR